MKDTIINFINTFWNFVAINILFFITCLPIFTIGAALSSLYFVMLREARDENGYLVRTYLKEFKNNFKSGTLAFIFLFILGGILVFNLAFWYALGNLLSIFVFSILILACIAYLLTFLYTFPLIGRFQNTTKQTLKNAFFISLLNRKFTIGLLFIDCLIFSICLFWPPMRLIMLFFGFAFVTYCKSFLYKKVFDSYENPLPSGLRS